MKKKKAVNKDPPIPVRSDASSPKQLCWDEPSNFRMEPFTKMMNYTERERERERERDWNSENPAFYSKSRPPYVPRVLYHLKIARVLELMERGEGLVELLPILPGSNVWICYYSLILPLFELLPILPGWTANVPKSLRKVMTSSVAREVANLSQLFLQ